MFKQGVLVAGILAALILATGCTGTGSGTASSTSTTTAAQTTRSAPTASSSAVTPQGLLAKKIGELGGEDCPAGADSCAVTFTVDRIEINPVCYPQGAKPASGRKTVVLHVSLTTKTLGPERADLVRQVFSAWSMKGVSPDGTVTDAEPGTCTNNEGRLPATFLPNSKYTGRVEVTIPDTAVSIASAPANRANSEGQGWVWPLS